VQVFDYDSTGSDLWVAADKDFEAYFKEKHPNITVKRTTAPFTGFAERLLTSLAGGASYDCIYGYSAWLPQFVSNHAVQPLASFLKQDTGVSEDSFFDYGKDSHKGKTYGLAWYVGAQFPMYNKTEIKKAGLPDPADLDSKGKWDYSALQNLARELTRTGSDSKQVYGIDMSFTNIDSTYNAWSRCWGTDVWNSSFTKCLLDSPRNVELWKYIQNFYTNKWTPTPTGVNGSDPFGIEQVMMTVTGPFYFRTAIQDKVPQRFDIGMTRNPKGAGGQTSVAGVNAYYMGNGSNPTGGWTWYGERSFSARANKLYLAVGSGRFPVRKSVQPATQYSWEDVSLYNALRRDMFASPISPQESEFEQLYTNTWDEMALKNGSIKTLLTQLTQQADQQLQGA
jgi:multiple sugar transport system substrate-binding protein